MPTLKDANKYEKGYETSTVNNINYEYHYIKFTAKYGAKIEDMWPCDVFNSVTRSTNNTHGNWSQTTAFVSAWNGENNVFYSQNNTNQTIKGKYQILDHTLLWDYSISGTKTNGKASEESKTVSYACYWLNGANISWSVPSLFEYYIHLPGLNGASETVIKYDTYDDYVNGNNLNEKHKHPSIEGFTSSGSIRYSTISEYDTSLYKYAYEIHFDYTRNQNKLTFDDRYSDNTTEYNIPYGTDLNPYSTYVPNNPNNIETNSATFEGWYIDEECSVLFNFNTTMPDEAVYLYAKWDPTYWDVNIYTDESMTNKLSSIEDVPFGTILSSAQEPTRTPPVTGYIFAGWYYNDNGVEKRFDFNTMPVKGHLNIYAKWTSEVPVPFTVYYVTYDINGQRIEIADPTTGVSLAGISKSFKAKVNSDLYDEYNKSYFPTAFEQTQQMVNGENIITFEYVTGTNIKYRVKHVFTSADLQTLLGDTDTLTFSWEYFAGEASEARLTFNFRDSIKKDVLRTYINSSENGYTKYKEKFDQIWDIIVTMSPDAYSKNLTLVANSTVDQNEVVFNWESKYNTVTYEVRHHFQKLDNTEKYELRSTQTLSAAFDQNTFVKASYDIMNVMGFTYDHIEHNSKNNDDPILFKPTVNPDGQLGDGLIIDVYYNRVSYDYYVFHYDKNTGILLYNGEDKKSGLYEQQITIESIARSFDYYYIENGSEVFKLISPDMQINCYYIQHLVNYNYEAVGVGGFLDPFSEEVSVGSTPGGSTVSIQDISYHLESWYYRDTNDGNKLVDINTVGATQNIETGHIQPAEAKTEDAGKTFTFVAKMVPNELTIENILSIAENTPTEVTEDQGFVYVITGTDISLRVASVDSVTVYGLPKGEYTVSVEGWSWRYTSQIQEISFDGDDTLSFTHTDSEPDRTTGYYITDEAHN